MAKSGSSVAHCIGSNTKAAKGVAPVSSMLEHGMTVGLGTDGPASGNTLDLFTQMRFCANFHKNETGDRSAFPAKDIVKDKQLVSQDFRQIREDLQQKMNQTAFGGMGNAVLA